MFGIPSEWRSSAREREVLRPPGRGPIQRRDRAGALFLSDATVKTHVTHILTKLRLRDRVQAVALAYRPRLHGHAGEMNAQRRSCARRAIRAPRVLGKA